MVEGKIGGLTCKPLPQKRNWKEGATRIIGKTNSKTHFIDENCSYKFAVASYYGIDDY
jgi:hypothetical protein